MSDAFIIDTDVHVNPASVEVLFPYLAENWREYITQSAFKGPTDNYYPISMPTSARPGTKPKNGVPGSNFALLRKQALESRNVERAILSCAYAVDGIHNPDAAAAIAAATNDWLADEWLNKDARLRAALVAPNKQPEMAAKEIDRMGSHPGFVSVFLPVHSEALYGNRRYYPIYEAAARHNLVVGIHYGGAPGNPPTPSGFPSYYVEDYVDMSTIFQSQVLNLIAEGVFDRFPTLRMTLVESGVTWLPAWLWRIDKEWKGLRREIPWSRRLPSEYIREHIRLTSAPLDVAPDEHQTLEVFDQFDAENMLMYASDYPHWHDERDGDALPSGLTPLARQRILRDNALAWYRW